jgi:hypothetical protein
MSASETFTIEVKNSSGGSEWVGAVTLEKGALSTLVNKIRAIRIPTTRPSVDIQIQTVSESTGG